MPARRPGGRSKRYVTFAFCNSSISLGSPAGEGTVLKGTTGRSSIRLGILHLTGDAPSANRDLHDLSIRQFFLELVVCNFRAPGNQEELLEQPEGNQACDQVADGELNLTPPLFLAILFIVLATFVFF